MIGDGKAFRQTDKALDRSLAEADLIILVRELVNELRGEREPVPDHEVRVVDDAAGRSASGARDGSSSAVHRRLPAIFKTRPRRGSYFTTIGSTPEIAAIWGDGQVFITGRDLAESLADITMAIQCGQPQSRARGFSRRNLYPPIGTVGLLSWRFQVASEAGLPIIPGALRGTRWMLRSDQ